MPNQDLDSDNRCGEHRLQERRSTEPERRELAWTPDTIARWADLIATGEVQMPELDATVELRLAEAVRTRRRQRLVRLIARLIALDIEREAEQGRIKHDS